MRGSPHASFEKPDFEGVTLMPVLPRICGRYSTRATLSVGFSAAVLLILSAALAAWDESPIVGVLTLSGCALTAGVFVAVRRVLRRASAQIDLILREELQERSETSTRRLSW